MIAIPLVIFWGIASWGLLSRGPVLIFLFAASQTFGAMAVIPTELTGGLTFIPATMTGMLIVAKVLLNGNRARSALAAALSFRRGALLSAFWFVALTTTIFAPYLFSGRIMIITMRIVSAGVGPSPLYGTMQNLSQLAYLTISVLMAFAFAQAFKTAPSRQTLLTALVFGGYVVVLSGILDYASQFAPIGPVLAMFRTASYSMLVEAEMLGGKRVVGLMPEASSFGSLCIAFLSLVYFLRSAISDERTRNLLVPPLLVCLLLLSYLSTSSAAYVGIAVFLAIAVLEWVMRAVGGKQNPLRRRNLGAEFAVGIAALAGIAALLLFSPTSLDKLMVAVNEMVFKKTGTSSFAERNMWTAVSLQALWDTYGFGVGLGSTRASNVVVAVFSSTGILGGLLYYGFVLRAMLFKPDPQDLEGAAMLMGLRYTIAPSFVVALLVGTTADFGSLGALRLGAMMAIGGAGMSFQRWQRAARQRSISRPA